MNLESSRFISQYSSQHTCINVVFYVYTTAHGSRCRRSVSRGLRHGEGEGDGSDRHDLCK